jgi:hypothetical protein
LYLQKHIATELKRIITELNSKLIESSKNSEKNQNLHLIELKIDESNHSAPQKAKIIQNSIHDFSEDDHHNFEEKEDDENIDTIIKEDRKEFSNHCQLIQIILKSQLKNIAKLQGFEIISHRVYLKDIPKLKIKDPGKYITKNNFVFIKLVNLNAENESNDRNRFDDEGYTIDKWWNDGMNDKEINMKLFKKRKKYFTWQFSYDMLMNEYKYKIL